MRPNTFCTLQTVPVPTTHPFKKSHPNNTTALFFMFLLLYHNTDKRGKKEKISTGDGKQRRQNLTPKRPNHLSFPGLPCTPFAVIHMRANGTAGRRWRKAADQCMESHIKHEKQGERSKRYIMTVVISQFCCAEFHMKNLATFSKKLKKHNNHYCFCGFL